MSSFGSFSAWIKRPLDVNSVYTVIVQLPTMSGRVSMQAFKGWRIHRWPLYFFRKTAGSHEISVRSSRVVLLWQLSAWILTKLAGPSEMMGGGGYPRQDHTPSDALECSKLDRRSERAVGPSTHSKRWAEDLADLPDLIVLSWFGSSQRRAYTPNGA